MPPHHAQIRMTPEAHMRRAIALSLEMMRSGKGGPFGAVIVQGGIVIAEGFNQVTSEQRPDRARRGRRHPPRLPCTADAST